MEKTTDYCRLDEHEFCNGSEGDEFACSCRCHFEDLSQQLRQITDFVTGEHDAWLKQSRAAMDLETKQRLKSYADIYSKVYEKILEIGKEVELSPCWHK